MRRAPNRAMRKGCQRSFFEWVAMWDRCDGSAEPGDDASLLWTKGYGARLLFSTVPLLFIMSR